MPSLHASFDCLICGPAQGVLLGSVAAPWLGLGGASSLLLILLSALLGIPLGYYQLVLYHRLFGKR
ncbi:hypothetical protein [Prosthecobacter vanneervenii]|uniref:Uncharacterized protein n=1 Tax=Prosthecobacter vanneervenii TaxID=48466 RepID=A0A7W8DIW2_9BACT|nr:hypothetical protein [Prosthecobacter vanneervenii]MBB5031488.1 hypothetical protein [Prosthecobacter vanneervenii]